MVENGAYSEPTVKKGHTRTWTTTNPRLLPMNAMLLMTVGCLEMIVNNKKITIKTLWKERHTGLQVFFFLAFDVC